MKKIFTLLTVAFIAGVPVVAQTTGSFSKSTTYNGASYTYSYYVPTNYNANSKYTLLVGLFGYGDNADNYRDVLRNSVALGSNSPLAGCIVVVPSAGSDKAFGPPDTGMVTIVLNDAMNNYNIDSKSVYLNGFSYGGRQALQYGLLNYWKFKGLELWTPAFQTDTEAKNKDAFKYKYENGKYIPICITVGSDDNGYNVRVPQGYQMLIDSGSTIATLKIIYGMQHSAPPDADKFSCFNYLMSNAVASTGVDAGIDAINAPFTEICNTTFTPIVSLQNKGTTTLTSATINYQIDGGSVMTQSWSGSLKQLGKTNITLPQQTVSVGSHTFKAYTTSPNNGADVLASNDATTVTFTSLTKGGVSNFSQGFETTVFPPTGWQQAGTDKAWKWNRTNSVGGSGSSCSIYYDNAVPNTIGKKYSIRTNIINFTGASTPVLTYDYAYAPYQSGSQTATDTLVVYYSTNCGSTWTKLLAKGGLNLSSTGGYVSTFFVPTAQQWSKETVNLNSLIGQPEVMFSFENHSGWGNTLFLDNINLTGVTGMVEANDLKNTLNIFPNPSNGKFDLSFTVTGKENITVNIFNALGQSLYTENLNQFNGNYSNTMDVSNHGAGVYFVNIISGNDRITKKVVVQ